jgi:isoleucyl-tRNA synthetase
MVAEEIHLGLCGPGQDGDGSVHLEDWPDTAELPQDPGLVADMDRIREVCSVALGLREDHRLRTRLPLRRLTIAGNDLRGLDGLTHLVRDEVNVKEVVLTDDLSSVGQFLLRPNAKVLGPRLGKAVQTVIGAAKAGEWTQLDDGTVSIAGETLAVGEFELALEPGEGRIAAPLRDNAAVVELDVEVTDELRDEGRARDVVRAVQQARKDAGLHVSDRITLTVSTGEELATSLGAHQEWIDAQVLAAASSIEQLDGGGDSETDGLRFSVHVTRAG